MASQREQVWFITGSSKGLGYEFAEYALKNGHKVVATARDTSVLIPLLEKYKDKVLTATLDVNKYVDIRNSVSSAINGFGHIDVLINNAGYDVIGPVEEATEDLVRPMFDTHFFGPVALIKEVLPHMRRQQSGTIVNISSVLGSRTSAGYGEYSATKCALEGMSEALSDELQPFGIRVMIVKPGSFRTDILSPEGNLKLTPASGVYDEGHSKERHIAIHGVQQSDPKRVAEALDKALRAECPPLRLLLGSDCYTAVTSALQEQLREYEAWREVSLSTDFPSEK
jgi:NAD(P)-dependent dehydrogenase (short-subunit alcohol dehydrogenase family)